MEYRADPGDTRGKPAPPRAEKLRTAFTVRTGDDHNIAIRIAQPDLPMSGRGIDMRFLDDLGSQGARPLHGRVEIVYLEPQQDTVSRRCCVCIDEVGVVFLVPGVQLKKQLT